MTNTFRLALAASVALAALTGSGHALKYAATEHHIKADPSIPDWKPGDVPSEPEEELNVVGADVMDEITLGWIKIFRKQYPRLSLTMEARASGAGAPGLVSGHGMIAPVGRELLPKEREAFVQKFGYEPLEIKVATGSLGSLGKTAASIIMVDKDNPLPGLTLAQIDAIYSTTDKRGHADIKTWGELGLKGDWANMPIHLYGLKSPNGIEQFIKAKVLLGGDWKPTIENVKGVGFTHAFTVAAEDMAKHPGGMTYALMANLRSNTRVVPLADKAGEPFVMPTVETVYDHSYPLSRYVYIYLNRKPGTQLEPKVKEFMKLVLSQQGQDVVAEEGVYMPLQAKVVAEELKKLD